MWEKTKIKEEYLKIQNEISNFYENEARENVHKVWIKMFLNCLFILSFYILELKCCDISSDIIAIALSCLALIMLCMIIPVGLFDEWSENKINGIKEKHSIQHGWDYDIYKNFVFVEQSDILYQNNIRKRWEQKDNQISCFLRDQKNKNRKIQLSLKNADFMIIHGEKYLFFENSNIL